jgi:hypothetical protein
VINRVAPEEAVEEFIIEMFAQVEEPRVDTPAGELN